MQASVVAVWSVLNAMSIFFFFFLCFVFFNKVCNPMDTQNKTALRKTVS